MGILVYIALVCSAVILVQLLNVIVAAIIKKKRLAEKEAPSQSEFVTLEEERQAEVRDIINDL